MSRGAEEYGCLVFCTTTYNQIIRSAEVNNKSIKYIGRKESASTATGLFKKHLQEQEQIIETLLNSKS